MNNSGIEIFKADDGQTEIQVNLNEETVWLSQKQMSLLFEKDTDTISLHLRNIFNSGELAEKATTEDFSVVQKEGKREVNRKIRHYNLDAIISVGYRVNSKRGIQFRIWATKILKYYLIQGYSLNEKRLLQQNEYFKELCDSVRILGNIVSQKSLSNKDFFLT